MSRIFDNLSRYRQNQNIAKEDVSRAIKIYDDMDFSKKVEIVKFKDSFFLKTDSAESGDKQYNKYFHQPLLKEVIFHFIYHFLLSNIL